MKKLERPKKVHRKEIIHQKGMRFNHDFHDVVGKPFNAFSVQHCIPTTT